MSKATFIFKAIDYMFNPFQNPGKITRKGKKFCEITNDIPFGEGKYQKLDTYKPKDAEGKMPVIFEIHGGGFVAGDKKYRRALCEWYSMNTGAFVVSINYALGPEFKFIDAQRDIFNAFNFVGDHAEEWNLNMDKVVVTGDSAGGWAAAQICAAQDSEYMQEKTGVKLKYRATGALFNCGIYDIETAVKQKVLFNLTESISKDFIGCSVKDMDKFEYLDIVSSKSYVTANWPTSFVVYAEQDFFCGGQGEQLCEKLDELGVYQEHYGSTKFSDNHTFSLTWSSKATKECNVQILSFLNRFFADEIGKKNEA